ncbi:MAG TPA: UDP-N-acetylglucosamine 1-carboxyvinyltransferase [Vicinamibacteria bacterium]|nr:UDP-N-acetylglucosamine 1-carboxyvinyltransferase [Vicinamibacteria bacterium]
MATLVVEGGRRLAGVVEVEGNKNAALPLLAACLLTPEECVFENAPRIRDVDAMCALLQGLGAEVDGVGTSTLRVRCRELRTTDPDPSLVARLRGSVLLLAPLLARAGRAGFGEPGGDFPGRRSMATHHRALAALGAIRETEESGPLVAPEGLRGASVYLDEASVTATETALLAAATARGTTEIRHAAAEPHVAELARFLRRLGAEISGEGTSTLRVTGVARLSGARHRIDGDFIEAGTWAVAAAATGGEVEVRGARALDMEPIVAVLSRFGVRSEVEEGRLRVLESAVCGAGRVTTGVWPGFPSDMVSLVTVLATQARGSTLVHDWLYELRLFALEQLSGMGADLFLCDPHRIVVTGPRRLRRRALDSRDLRSGMALVVAALCADGSSRIDSLETIERGYARLVERLRGLGAAAFREG